MRRNGSPPRRKNRSPPRPVRTHQCARASLALKPRASLFEPVAAINAWPRETGDQTQESTRLFTRVCNQRRASARRGHLRNQRRADTRRWLLYTRAGPDRLTRTEPTHLCRMKPLKPLHTLRKQRSRRSSPNRFSQKTNAMRSPRQNATGRICRKAAARSLPANRLVQC